MYLVLIISQFLMLSAWSYDYHKFDLVEAKPEIMATFETFFQKLGYSTLSNMKGYPELGINQVFFHQDSLGFVSMKFDVASDFPLNELHPMNSGHLLHVKLGGKVTGFYFHNLPLNEIHNLASKIKQIDVGVVSTLKNLMLVPSAHASDCTIPGNLPMADDPTIPVGQRITESALTAGLFGCLRNLKDGAASRVDVIGAVSSFKRTASNFIQDPGKSVSGLYYAVSDMTVGVYQLIMAHGKMAVNPALAQQELNHLLGSAGPLLGSLLAVVARFPPQVAINIACALIGGVGMKTLIAAMTAGAGAAALALQLGKLVNSIGLLKKLVEVMQKLKVESLEKLGLAQQHMEKLFEKLAAGTLKEKQLDVFIKSLEADSPFAKGMALRGLQCSLS